MQQSPSVFMPMGFVVEKSGMCAVAHAGVSPIV
jgi:hypothetical protein